MSELKHTPGPWHVAAVDLRRMEAHTALAVWDETHGQADDSILGRPICMLTPIETLNPMDEANARLIAAARACKKAEEGLIEAGAALGMAGDRNTYAEAEAGLIAVQRAIAKAEARE